MYKGELFNYRYGEILAAIEANPGVSNIELAQAFALSYSIIRALTAAMEKEGDIAGRVERSGLYSKTLWHVNPHKECLENPRGRPSIAKETAAAPPATHSMRVHVVETEAQPATRPVRVHVTEQALPVKRRVPFPEVEEYSLPVKYTS